MTVMAATAWRTNADMIADCVRLGYLRVDAVTLDPTYGRGTWWNKWLPEDLTVHDIALDGVDFRDLPHDNEAFDAIAFDPPYVCVGGRKTTGMPDFHDRYGLTAAPSSPHELQALINDGLREQHRVLKPGGTLLVKCQDYVSSGKLWLGTHWTLSCGMGLSLECIDRLEHLSGPRPQPPGRRQVHARRNLSTLFVFRKKGK